MHGRSKPIRKMGRNRYGFILPNVSGQTRGPCAIKFTGSLNRLCSRWLAYVHVAELGSSIRKGRAIPCCRITMPFIQWTVDRLRCLAKRNIVEAPVGEPIDHALPNLIRQKLVPATRNDRTQSRKFKSEYFFCECVPRIPRGAIRRRVFIGKKRLGKIFAGRTRNHDYRKQRRILFGTDAK